MTIKEVITTADSLRPNSISNEIKTNWLKGFEQRLYNEIYSHYTDYEGESDMSKYDEETELSLPSPYDDMYHHHLAAMIDYSNAEYDRYNNDIDMLGALYEDFERYYNNTHTSAGVKTLTV